MDHEHGAWSTLTSITNFKMLGGYRGLTSRIFLDFNWITSITKLFLLGGYRPCTTLKYDEEMLCFLVQITIYT